MVFEFWSVGLDGARDKIGLVEGWRGFGDDGGGPKEDDDDDETGGGGGMDTDGNGFEEEATNLVKDGDDWGENEDSLCDNICADDLLVPESIAFFREISVENSEGGNIESFSFWVASQDLSDVLIEASDLMTTDESIVAFGLTKETLSVSGSLVGVEFHEMEVGTWVVVIASDGCCIFEEEASNLVKGADGWEGNEDNPCGNFGVDVLVVAEFTALFREILVVEGEGGNNGFVGFWVAARDLSGSLVGVEFHELE